MAIACAFGAKAVYGFSTTRQLLEALERDAQLRRICGWKTARQVPHESTFSRAFEEFSQMQLPEFVHEALIRETQSDRLIGHIARDSTAIEAREHFPETPAQAAERKAARKAHSRARRREGDGPFDVWSPGAYRGSTPQTGRLVSTTRPKIFRVEGFRASKCARTSENRKETSCAAGPRAVDRPIKAIRSPKFGHRRTDVESQPEFRPEFCKSFTRFPAKSS